MKGRIASRRPRSLRVCCPAHSASSKVGMTQTLFRSSVWATISCTRPCSSPMYFCPARTSEPVASKTNQPSSWSSRSASRITADLPTPCSPTTRADRAPCRRSTARSSAMTAARPPTVISAPWVCRSQIRPNDLKKSFRTLRSRHCSNSRTVSGGSTPSSAATTAATSSSSGSLTASSKSMIVGRSPSATLRSTNAVTTERSQPSVQS